VATVNYRIRVAGHLDPSWSEWFDGLAITNLGSGDTVLAGLVIDQAELHGLLAKIRDLGLQLLEVQQEQPRWMTATRSYTTESTCSSC
jgi:hypothetical protein